MSGFWPIMWIVINALWIFNMTEATGCFAVLRRAFNSVSDDPRVQVVVIAFRFGALVADTAPVAFGAIAIPITTLGQTSGLPVHHLSMMVGRALTPGRLGRNLSMDAVSSHAGPGP